MKFANCWNCGYLLNKKTCSSFKDETTKLLKYECEDCHTELGGLDIIEE